MIERIPDLPEGTLGFTATGTVTAHDYETVIIPTVEDHLTRHKRLRLVYHLGQAFTGFEASALWDDAKLGLKHMSELERVALVSDVEWIRGAANVFRLLIPGTMRLFHNAELAEAKRWIAA